MGGYAGGHRVHLRIGNHGRRRQAALDLCPPVAQIADRSVDGRYGLGLRLHDRRRLMFLGELPGQCRALGTLGVEFVLHLTHLEGTETVVDDLRLGIDLRAEGIELRVGVARQGVGLIERCELAFVALALDGGADSQQQEAICESTCALPDCTALMICCAERPDCAWMLHRAV